MFSDGQTFFLKHTDSGKCITRRERPAYANSSNAFPYFVAMTENCLNFSAQFSYGDTELLKKQEHSLKQTNNGFLSFYKMNASVCVDPTSANVIRNTTCDTKKQKFTFGR